MCTLNLLLGPILPAIRTLIKIVQDASRHYVIGVGWVDGDARLADPRFEGRALMDFHRLCIRRVWRKQKHGKGCGR